MTERENDESRPAIRGIAMPLFHGAQNHCFGCGEKNPVGLKLKFSVLEDGAVEALAMISNDYEGPPGYLHGGIIATLLDEAMSKANRANGVTAMTRTMEVEYLRPVPSGRPIRIVGRVLRSEGRKHWTAAQIVLEREPEVLEREPGVLEREPGVAGTAERESGGGSAILAQGTGLFIAIRT